MRHDRSLRTNARAGFLLVAVLAAAGAYGVWERSRDVVAPEGEVDPKLVHRVDLNRAGADEVAALPGIGDILAGRIVTSRDQEGMFERIEALSRVHGIGPGIIERIRAHVICGPERP